jgi:hypothetical protein
MRPDGVLVQVDGSCKSQARSNIFLQLSASEQGILGTATSRQDIRMASSSKKKPGLYANIHAKQDRIAHGSGEQMRKPGTKGAPTAEAFDQAAKTGKPAKKAADRKK